MANSISIQIHATGAPTSTPDAVDPGGAVKYTNKAAAAARIDFGSKSPFCPQQLAYALKAGKSKTLYVCTNYGIGGTYSYTTTVKGAETQSASLTVISLQSGIEPIVFPEKQPIVFPEDLVPLLFGLGVGAIVGFVVGKRRVARST
jgi:hypothetical protein